MQGFRNFKLPNCRLVTHHGVYNTLTPDGTLVEYVYQNDLQKIRVKEVKGTWSDYATYDSSVIPGGLSNINYANGTRTEYTYDSYRRISSNTVKGNSTVLTDTRYTWSRANKLQRVQVHNANNTVVDDAQYNYDNRGRITYTQRIISGTSYNKNYAFDKASNLIRNGDNYFAFDSIKKHQLKHICSGAVPAGQSCPSNKVLGTLIYDSNGNVISKTKGITTVNYTWDALNRLIEVKKNGKLVNKFTYDTAGKRISKSDYTTAGVLSQTTYYVGFYEILKPASGKEVRTKYIIGPSGLIAAISTSHTSIIFSQNDESDSVFASLADFGGPWAVGDDVKVAGFGGDGFWEGGVYRILLGLLLLGLALVVFSRLVWVDLSNSESRNSHKSLGFKVNSVVCRSICLWLIVAHLGVFVVGQNVAQADNGIPEAGKVLYFHADHLGSTTLVTSDTGEEVSQRKYDAYGTQIVATGSDNYRAKFSGKEWDASTELYYFEARYMDPELGRFMSTDPAKSTFSPYVYTSGDPMTQVDPDGKFWGTVMLVLGIVLAVAGGAYAAAASANHSGNPAKWDWSSGMTWGAVFIGAALGAVMAGGSWGAGFIGASIGGVAGSAFSTAGSMASFVVFGGLNAMVDAGFAGTNLEAEDFVKAATFGVLTVIPYFGVLFMAAYVAYDVYNYINEPNALNGIALGRDIGWLGLSIYSTSERILTKISEETTTRGGPEESTSSRYNAFQIFRNWRNRKIQNSIMTDEQRQATESLLENSWRAEVDSRCLERQQQYGATNTTNREITDHSRDFEMDELDIIQPGKIPFDARTLIRQKPGSTEFLVWP